MSLPRFSSLVAVVLLLSGCAGAGSTNTAPAAPLGSLAANATGIRGTVISTELVPIGGALLQVDQDPPFPTDAAGHFETAVAAGSHQIAIQALGFQSLVGRFEVADGEQKDLQFQLDALAVTTPYVQLLLHTGFETCSFSAGLQAANGETLQKTYHVPCQFGQPNTSFPVEMTDDWKYVVMEETWPTTDSMWFLSTSVPGNCNTGKTSFCWAQAMGRSPLRLEGAPNSTEHAKRYAIDGKTPMPEGKFKMFADSAYLGQYREEINNTAGPQCVTIIQATGTDWNPSLGCGLGYGYSTGIKIQYYVSVFHFEAPENPTAYSARPDA